MIKPKVAKIRIYPIKSLSPLDLQSCEVGIHSLSNDRLYAMFDDTGRVMNGKRNSRVNLLHAEYDLENGSVSFTNKETGIKDLFELKEGNKELDSYLSTFFGVPLRLIKNASGQFMDIPVESSVTVVSTASLSFLENHMEGYSIDDLRLRFRSSLEIEGVPAFWEETLFSKRGVGVEFSVGDVTMIGASPRARCNVPPQHPDTGELDRRFVMGMLNARNELVTEHSYLLVSARIREDDLFPYYEHLRGKIRRRKTDFYR